MKKLLVLLILTSGVLFAQDRLDSIYNLPLECSFDNSNSLLQAIDPNPVPVTGTKTLTMLLAVSQDYANDRWISYSDYLMELDRLMKDYYNKCSFGQFSINIKFIYKSIQGDQVECFVINGPSEPKDSVTVATNEQIIEILNVADPLFNFNEGDADGDGRVDHFCFIKLKQVTPQLNGVAFQMPYWISNDLVSGSTNQFVKITSVGSMKSGTQPFFGDNLYIILHELTHSLFGFPDIEHGGGDVKWFGMGSFDGRFHDRPSLYNPLFRLQNGWVTPTNYSISQTIELKNFETDPPHPIYQFSNDNLNDYPKSKFWLTYIDNNDLNYWNEKWPIPNDPLTPNSKKGVLIWRRINGNSFANKLEAPISLESAHGKWEWDNEPVPFDRNIRRFRKLDTNGNPIPNIVHGLDSLFLRGTYIWKQNGIMMATYEDFRIGSENCFYTHGDNFAFYTNPSSNLINSSDNFGRGITSDIALKNFRIENGKFLIDFIKGAEAYNVTTSETIKADKLYINNRINIYPGATLKIIGNSELLFNNNAQIVIMDGAKLIADATIFNFQDNTGNQGTAKINVSSGGELELNNCTIINCWNGIYANNPNNLRIKGSTINSENIGIRIISSTGEVLIENCNIKSGATGILSTNNNYVNIKWNTIEAKMLGIALYNNNISYLMNNKITGKSDQCIGVLLDRCLDGNFIKNEIRDCFRGLYTISSSLEMGENKISYNYQYGLLSYNAITKLSPSDESTIIDNVTYSSLGYNYFYNNGQMANGNGYNSEIHLLGFSEIYFNLPGYNGQNAIYDDRTVPFERWWLISGDVSIGSINAEKTYWGTYGHPNGRFYNLNVSVDPILETPPIPPLFQNSNYIVQFDDYGNFLDTVYSRESFLHTPTELDAQMELVQSYINDSLFQEAKNLVNYIINNNVDEAKTIDFYHKLLLILNITNASSEEYQSFYNAIYNNLTQTSDSNKIHFLEDLAIQVCVSNDEYLEAISKLEYLLDQYDPNTEEAFATELEIALLGILGNGLEKNTQSNNSPDEVISKIIKKMSNHNNYNTVNSIEPVKYLLCENYPNPFNPSTNIGYSLPVNGFTTLKVYDVLGNEVATLVNEDKQPGSYTVEFNASNLSSGVYFYNLTSGSFTMNKKMILMK